MPAAPPDPTPPPSPPRHVRRTLLRRFRRDANGVTAVEFSLVAMPFFAILFSILEVSLAFWTSQVMESMIADASRQIYTGQFQLQASNQGKSAAQLAEAFKDMICGTEVKDGQKVNRLPLFDCHGKLKIDVRSYSAFPGAITPPVTNGALDTSSFTYQNSQPNEIVVVRAALEYPVFVSLLNTNQGNLANGNRLLMATATFRNEPYQ
ncbi:TadE/TadG family type IV pilus assembly protein [Salinarimonas soli]|nr:TadE/TadG family type IV pilus assembly protein [Salinarimonas soli]